MKTIILTSLLLGFCQSDGMSSTAHISSVYQQAQRGTTTGYGTTKAGAMSSARRQFPSGAQQSGAPRFVQQGKKWVCYLMWKKKSPTQAQRGTTTGYGTTKAGAMSSARRQFPSGAQQSGAPRFVQQGKKWVCYLMWYKKK